jgi:hypothetical protein
VYLLYDCDKASRTFSQFCPIKSSGPLAAHASINNLLVCASKLTLDMPPLSNSKSTISSATPSWAAANSTLLMTAAKLGFNWRFDEYHIAGQDRITHFAGIVVDYSARKNVQIPALQLAYGLFFV